MLRNQRGEAISSVDGWTRPKRASQWKRGRSARELASAWFRSPACGCPNELMDLLSSHEVTRETEFIEGCPEFVTALPQRGEGRNHDLWLRGHNKNGRVTVYVEAKADESFGQPVGEAVTNALQKNPRSRLPLRARDLLALLFGRECDRYTSPWKDLRYQLVTAFAGTVLQAPRDRSQAAVLVIHEFTGGTIDPELQSENAADLRRFIHLLFANNEPLRYGSLLGPRLMRHSSLESGIQLFIGKIQSPIAR